MKKTTNEKCAGVIYMMKVPQWPICAPVNSYNVSDVLCVPKLPCCLPGFLVGSPVQN